MATTVAPPPRFATHVGEGTPGRGWVWVWPLTVLLHAFFAAAVVVAPILGREPLPDGNDRVTNAFFVSPSYVAPPPPPPPPPRQVVRVGGVIREPRKVKDVAPAYPNIAKAAKIQGLVILECQVSPQGKVESVKVLRSVPTLDEPAIEAVRQWVYTPTLINGVPVGVILTVTVNFVLRDGMR